MTDMPPIRDYAHSQAVLVGTWDYEFLPPVPAARNSLRRMVSMLAGPLCGWPESRLLVLDNKRDPGDLADRLITAFEETADVVLFYYVGHGQIDPDDQLCLGLRRSRPEPNRRAATSLTFSAVRRAMLDSNAATKIVILDCCFAGLASRPASTLTALTDDVLDRAAGTGAYTMAASSAYTTAWYESGPERARPQTYFTKYLADVIETGIPGQPSGLRLHPIFTQLRERLAEDKRPVPTERSVDAARDFVFAHNAAPRETASVEESEQSDREPVDPATEADPAGRRLSSPKQGAARRRPVLIFGALGALIVAAGVTALLYLTRGGPPAQVIGTISEPGTQPVTTVAFSPNGKTIATGDSLGSAYLWHAANHGLITTFSDPGSRGIRAVAFSPNGKTIATADGDGSTYLWDTATHGLIATLTVRGSGPINAVAFNPNGLSLAAGAGDDQTRTHTYIWKVATHKLVATFSQPGNQGVHSLAFSPGGNILATGEGGGRTYLWSIATHQQVATLKDDPGSVSVVAVLFAPDGKTIITADLEGRHDAYLWDAVTHRLVASLRDPSGGLVTVLGASLSPDAKILAVGVSDGPYHYTRLWDVATRRPSSSLRNPGSQGVQAVAFSTTGKALASGDANGRTYIWRIG
jgi:WD40 repeat protein